MRQVLIHWLGNHTKPALPKFWLRRYCDCENHLPHTETGSENMVEQDSSKEREGREIGPSLVVTIYSFTLVLSWYERWLDLWVSTCTHFVQPICSEEYTWLCPGFSRVTRYSDIQAYLCHMNNVTSEKGYLVADKQGLMGIALSHSLPLLMKAPYHYLN